MTAKLKIDESRSEMQTIKMPGFTAETSLYQSSQHYQMAMSKNSLAHLPVLPQLPPIEELLPGWEPEFQGGTWDGKFVGVWNRLSLRDWVYSNGRPSWTNPIFSDRDTINPGIGDVGERQSRVCVTRCNRLRDRDAIEECLLDCNT